jgi:hypothetical protein
LVAQAAGAPSWRVASVRLGDRDVTRSGVIVTDGVQMPPVIVTLTDEVAALRGTFVDPQGRPATDYVVVLIPADRAFWNWQYRRIATSRPDTNGGFEFGSVVPGAYVLGAVVDLSESDLSDRSFLEQLASVSLPVQLRSGQTTIQNIGTP